jgi:hypothetical protein
MYPLGTCNGVQDVTAAPTRAVPMSPLFPNTRSAIESLAQRLAGAAPNPLAHSPRPHNGRPKPVRAAPAPCTGNVSFRGSRHCQYLPFLFQTARVEVGHLVKED